MIEKNFKIQLSSKGQDFYHGVLPNLESAMKKGIRAGMKQAGFLIVKTLKDGIQRGPKTGRFYKRKGGAAKQASAPGEYAGIVTREYLDSADFNVSSANSMQYGFEDRKATWLEEGTYRMEPRPALGNATSARETDTFNILSREGHKFFSVLGGS